MAEYAYRMTTRSILDLIFNVYHEPLDGLGTFYSSLVARFLHDEETECPFISVIPKTRQNQ